VEAQNRIEKLLASEGHIPVGRYFTGAEVIRSVRKLGSAIVVCGFKLRDMTATELAENLKSSAVLLAVTSPINLDFCEGENLFKLATPVSRSDFFASLDILLQLEEKSLRPRIVRRREDEQQLILTAKKLMMEINRMSENEAHRFLQKKSMDSGLKMVETAQLIIDSYAH